MASRKKRKVRVKIRGYEPEDAPAVAGILSGKHVVEGTLQIPHRSVDEVSRQFAKPDPNVRLLVAEMDGDVAAFGGLSVERSLRARHVGHVWISVSEDVHGRGIGGHLLDALLDLGTEWMGLLRIQLEVFVDNEAAIKLYRERGFEIEGVIRGSALRKGKLVDSFLMGRMAENLPWPRVTARDAAQRMPALLSAGPDRSKN
jgi:putative acetyltransferase